VDRVEAGLYAATAPARERIRAKQREASERRRKKWLAGVEARHQRARETGESYDVLLAADVQAGDERVLAMVAERKRQRGRFLRQSTLVARTRARTSAPRSQPSRQGTSRERRTTRRVAGAARSRERPRSADDEPEHVAPAEWRGFLVASARMVQHCERRRAKWAAAT
jgi:hypothetical protein